ncbi:MAG: hypothetical protein V2A59_04510 [Candidatus Omnitrophota bacterium]
MVQDNLREIYKATLKRRGLLFFIFALAALFAGTYVWAESALTVNCAIPSIAGLNAPMIEEQKQENVKDSSKAEDTLKEDIQLSQVEPEVKKTLYSR